MGTPTSWPLKITRKDGQIEIYNDYEDFQEKSNTDLSKASVHFRVRETRLKGTYKGDIWAMVNADEYAKRFDMSETFICQFCEKEQPSSVYDDIEEKQVKGYVPFEMVDGYLGRKILAKQCLECARAEARRIFAGWDKNSYKSNI